MLVFQKMSGSGQYACVSLITAALLHVIKGNDIDWDMDLGPAAAIAVDREAPSLLQRICATVKCRNGECYLVNQSAHCACESTFRGDRCQFVNLDKVHYSFIGNLLVFEWYHPPRLKKYSFVYYEPLQREPQLFKKPIQIRESENSVLLGTVKGGSTRYRVCIEDDDIAERVMSTRSLDLLTNCMEITTGPDWHTLAGWCLAAVLSSVAVMLMYHQRDKIEILYFSKPYTMSKPRKNSAEELLNNSHSTQDLLNNTHTTEGLLNNSRSAEDLLNSSHKTSTHTLVNMNLRLEHNSR